MRLKFQLKRIVYIFNFLSITDHAPDHLDINQNTANVIKNRNQNRNVPDHGPARDPEVRALEATEMIDHLTTEVKNIIHRRKPNQKRREDAHQAAK